MAPAVVWRDFPFVLTFAGEYVFKDIVIATSAVVLAAALRGRHVWESDQYVSLRQLIERIEAPILKLATRYGHVLLRIAYAAVFLVFGAFKLVPGTDAFEPVVRAMVPVEPFNQIYAVVGVVEVLLAICLIAGRFQQIALLISVVIVGSTAGAILVPSHFTMSMPMVLTLEGQHLLKNVVFVGAALVLFVQANRQRLEPAKN